MLTVEETLLLHFTDYVNNVAFGFDLLLKYSCSSSSFVQYFKLKFIFDLGACQTTGCFRKKVAPPTFWNIFTLVKSFCVKFCKFVSSSYPHVSTNFCRFILIFHQMALIFSGVPSFSPCQVLSRPIHPENEMQLFRNDVIFFLIASLSVR